MWRRPERAVYCSSLGQEIQANTSKILDGRFGYGAGRFVTATDSVTGLRSKIVVGGMLRAIT